MKRQFLIIVLGLTAIASHGQNPAQTVKGAIIDKISEKPLSGASVSVEGSSISALTDVDGIFVLRHVPMGRIKINISFVGYQTASIPEV